jgi:hypothetical protein
MLDLSGVASKVQAPTELRETAIALGGVVRDQWASAKPEPSVIVQLEVVENMMSTAKSVDQRGDVSTILRLMGSRSLSARLGRGVGEAAEAARVTLLALMSMNAAEAEEAAPQASAAMRDAEKLEASGDLEGALEKYRLAAQSPGIGATALIHQADLSLKLGRPSEAYDLLDRARAFSKSGTFSRELIEEMALRAERASELKVRIDELKSQVIAAKDPYAALMELGGLQLKAGNLKGARESFADVARRFPGLKSLRARLNGAWCDENLGRRQAAFEECNRLIAEAKGIDPAVVTLAQFERARILHLEQRFVQAIDEYRDLAAAAAAVNADAQAALYFQVGYIYLNDLGDADQAFNTFKSLKTDRYRNSPFGQLAGQILAESGK